MSSKIDVMGMMWRNRFNLRSRIARGMSIEDAITTPLQRHYRNRQAGRRKQS